MSLKTVSRVINAEAGVTPATAERVTEAIDALGFERNDLAASLRQGRSSSTLGLVIEDVANPFYSAIAQAVEAAARDRGFLLITASAREDAERERELVGRAAAPPRRRAAGRARRPRPPLHRERRRARVFLDRPPHGIEADTVLLDNLGGARSAVEHLVAHGHTRIACVADTRGLYTVRERLAGYRAALQAAGIEEDPALVCSGNHDAAAAQAAVERLLALPDKRRPTAIFAANNRNTVGALHALAARRAASRWSASTTSSSPTCSASPSCAPTPGASASRPRRSRSRASTATTRPPREMTVPTELVARGSGEVAP